MTDCDVTLGPFANKVETIAFHPNSSEVLAVASSNSLKVFDINDANSPKFGV